MPTPCTVHSARRSSRAPSCGAGGYTYYHIWQVSDAPSIVHRLAAEHGDSRVIVQLDQFMEYHGRGMVLGTDLCVQMRELGFGGIISIISANDDEEAERHYRQSGADLSCSKIHMDELPGRLAEAHCARFVQPAAAGSADDGAARLTHRARARACTRAVSECE